MARRAFEDWGLPTDHFTWEHAQMAVLMDIRDLLKVIRDNTNVFNCRNARQIPSILRKIAANTDRAKCQEHPRYQAILPPRRDCKNCRRMYRRRHP